MGDGSLTVADINGGKNLTEEKNAAREYHTRKQEESRFLDTDTLAQKMENLEKIEVNDEDQALDIREVLHFYSHLTIPDYIKIIKKVLMDLHKEVDILQDSRSVTIQ